MNSAQEPLRIACIGEAMVELTLGNQQQSSAQIGYAGDSLNTAIYLKRLISDAADLAYITVLGNDPLSNRMATFIQSESISTRFVSRSANRAIGLYAIETDERGERSFSYWRSQSAARTLFQQGDSLDFSALSQLDVACLSAISLAILPVSVRHALLEELDRLRANNGLKVVFDSNYRPALWESQAQAQRDVESAWRITDIALPSVDDEMALFGDANEEAVLKRITDYGVQQGALKRGAAGPLSLDEQRITLPSTDTNPESGFNVVDTTAAGDSFNAGYLSQKLFGASDIDSLRAGHHCAVRVIAHPGAIIPKTLWQKRTGSSG